MHVLGVDTAAMLLRTAGRNALVNDLILSVKRININRFLVKEESQTVSITDGLEDDWDGERALY